MLDQGPKGPPHWPAILAKSGPTHNDRQGLGRCRKLFISKYLGQPDFHLSEKDRPSMPATIKSIQIGRVISEGNPDSRDILDRHWTTAFYKQPVNGPIKLSVEGLAGDCVADQRVHGGPDKAVLCYADSHYQSWAADHPDLKMAAGALGENLTITEADETSVCLGDRYRAGDCLVQVSQPRQPCWKIARRWGVKTLTKEVAQTGRTGWYLRVIQGGELVANQTLQLVDRSHPDWSVSRANDVMFGREVNRAAVIELMAIESLADAWKAGIA
jgi:MOSC domain-containing protein YiiM